jgi:hypothetical protein
MADAIMSSKEVLRMADELNDEPRALRRKHSKPQVKVGIEIDDGRGYLAVTDHETGARVTLELSIESMNTLGGLLVMADNPGHASFGCWLEGEAQVVR